LFSSLLTHISTLFKSKPTSQQSNKTPNRSTSKTKFEKSNYSSRTSSSKESSPRTDEFTSSTHSPKKKPNNHSKSSVRTEYTPSAASPPPVYKKKKMPTDWEIPKFSREAAEDHLFQDYDLAPQVLKALLEDLKFKKCSPIQALAIPPILDNKDLAGKAQTGTGKTAVFIIAVLQAYLKEQPKRQLNQPFALAIAPTRELAMQIARDAESMSLYTNLRTVAVYGGMDYNRQRTLLQSGCDLVVATPGRLIDYLHQNVLDLSAMKIMIIDEADRMLDMGFIPDVKRIMSMTPKPENRQTMLFSATLSHDIMNLASRWMRPNPTILEVEPEHILAEGINETIYACTSHEKFPILLWTLKNEDCERVIIFRNRRRDVEYLHDKLQQYDIPNGMLSGDVDQKKRMRILEDFRNGTLKIIVATDVAARGIHVDNVTHVFNYDLPYEANDYVHRVGRTARAGHKGRAISFASEDCAFIIPDIEEFIERPLPITQATDEMLVLPKPTNAFHSSKRPSTSAPARGKNNSRPSSRDNSNRSRSSFSHQR